MTITINGAKQTGSWTTLETLVSEVTGLDGRFTRIGRPDGSCDYRQPGEYDVTFTPEAGNDVEIRLIVSPSCY